MLRLTCCAVTLQENGAVAQVNILKQELAAAIAAKEAAEGYSAQLQQALLEKAEQVAAYKSQVISASVCAYFVCVESGVCLQLLICYPTCSPFIGHVVLACNVAKHPKHTITACDTSLCVAAGVCTYAAERSAGRTASRF